MQQPSRVVLSVDEVAEQLGISRPSAFKAIHNGEIPFIRIGRRILVPVAAFEKFLANANGESPPEA